MDTAFPHLSLHQWLPTTTIIGSSNRQQLLIVAGASVAILATALFYWHRGRPKKKHRRSERSRKIELSADIWADLVQWIPLKQLVAGMSLTNRKHFGIVASRLYEQQARIVDYVCIDREQQPPSLWQRLHAKFALADDEPKGKQVIRVRVKTVDSVMARARLVELPVVEPPQNIIGFQTIKIKLLNERVFAFLRLILPLLQRNSDGIPLYIAHPNCDDGEEAFDFLKLRKFCDMFVGLLTSISVGDEFSLDPYWNYCSPLMYSVSFLEFRNAYGSYKCQRHILRWLQTPRSDGQPRVLYIEECDRELIHRLRTAFERARQPCTYIVQMDIFSRFNDVPDTPAEFHLRNERTNERLELGRVKSSNGGGIMGGNNAVDNGGSQKAYFVLRRFPEIPASLDTNWIERRLARAKLLFDTTNCAIDEGWDAATMPQTPLNEIHLVLSKPYDKY